MRRPLDVLCIGEAMICLTPPTGPLVEATELRIGVGGAEANVACTLARLGHRTAWASRLGADAFGARVRASVARAGVDVGPVASGPGPTGAYVRELRPVPGSAPLYLRTGSEASRMSREDAVAWASTLQPAVVHVSGITAMLSASARRLVEAIAIERVFGDAIVSFDINARDALSGPETPALLLRLAQASDVVFVGRDEAERVWGTGSSDSVRDLLSRPATVVVKDADVDATEYRIDGATRVDAAAVEVIEATGAGDAFAAGWLGARLQGRGPRARLAEGHRLAAAALRSPNDLPPPELVRPPAVPA